MANNFVNKNSHLDFKRDLNQIRIKLENDFTRLKFTIENFKLKLLAELDTIEKNHDKEQQELEEDLKSLKKVSSILESSFTGNRLKEVLDEGLAIFESKKQGIIAKAKEGNKVVYNWDYELESKLFEICSIQPESVNASNRQDNQAIDVGVHVEDNINANTSPYLGASKGNLRKSVGNKGSGFGEFNCPSSIGVNNSGIIYVTDSNNDRVCVYSAEFEFLFHFGDKLAFGKMSYPVGIALSEDAIFISNASSHSISSYNFSGEFLKRIGVNGTKMSEFNHPNGLAYDGENQLLFVCDRGNNRVQVFTKMLEFRKELLRNELKNPLDIHITKDAVVILDEGLKCLHFLDKSDYAKTKEIITRGPEGQVKQPLSFEVNQEGLIFISDS